MIIDSPEGTWIKWHNLTSKFGKDIVVGPSGVWLFHEHIYRAELVVQEGAKIIGIPESPVWIKEVHLEAIILERELSKLTDASIYVQPMVLLSGTSSVSWLPGGEVYVVPGGVFTNRIRTVPSPLSEKEIKELEKYLNGKEEWKIDWHGGT